MFMFEQCEQRNANKLISLRNDIAVLALLFNDTLAAQSQKCLSLGDKCEKLHQRLHLFSSLMNSSSNYLLECITSVALNSSQTF